MIQKLKARLFGRHWKYIGWGYCSEPTFKSSDDKYWAYPGPKYHGKPLDPFVTPHRLDTWDLTLYQLGCL